MELTIEQALQQGVAAHREGKFQDAERLYRAILQSQPGHPDANHNLGLLAVAFNKADAALPLFRAALEANPKIEQFWLSYIDALIKEQQFDVAKQALEGAKKQGVAGEKLNVLKAQLLSKTDPANISPRQELINKLLEHYQSRKFVEAETLCNEITQGYPKHPFAWKVLGAVLQATGRQTEAATANQAAIVLSPQDAEAQYNLGVTIHELGRLEDAVASYTKAIVLKPDYAEAHYNMGVTLKELGKLEEALVSYSKAITFKPDYAEAHNNLGNTFQELGRLEEAETSYSQAITFKPDFALAHKNLSGVLKMVGRLGEAEEASKHAIALQPNFADAHYNRALILQDLGRLNEAVTSCRQALVLKRDFAEAHRFLTSIKKFDTRDKQFTEMLEIYLNGNLSEEQRCHINFGLAKACEDLDEFEQAFTYYSEGNKLRKKLLNYDIKRDEELFRKIKFNYLRIEQSSLEPNQLLKYPIPIFIVGMPRSGTTLIEQIISSHPQVTGAGELSYVAQFGAAVAKGFSEVNNYALANFRHKYLTKLRNISIGNLMVTDKTPHNFLFIGLISAAFPEAKILHIKRNPAAVCWANYKQYFGSNSIGYCYAIDDVISYYKLYEDLMSFWISRLGKRVYNLDYELLTDNQESETRQLIEYLGLGWDDKCLSPENNTRSVATASNLQVRQKVYKGSSEQWKKYKPFLNGAFDELEV